MSRKGKREGKTTAKQRLSTRQLMNTRRITEYSLETYDGDELVYFIDPAHQPVGSFRIQCRSEGVCPDECAEGCG